MESPFDDIDDDEDLHAPTGTMTVERSASRPHGKKSKRGRKSGRSQARSTSRAASESIDRKAQQRPGSRPAARSDDDQRHIPGSADPKPSRKSQGRPGPRPQPPEEPSRSTRASADAPSRRSSAGPVASTAGSKGGTSPNHDLESAENEISRAELCVRQLLETVGAEFARGSAAAATSDTRELEIDRTEHYARQLRDTVGAVFLHASVGPTLQMTDKPQAFKIYRDALIRAAGNPADPFEIMLIEQVAMAHMNIGRLHYECSLATDAERVKVYGALAVALTGEMRRTILALKVYRGETLVVPRGASPRRCREKARDSELESTGGRKPS
jgi:hypothetical protein